MPILRADILVSLRGNIVGSDDFDENVLEILFVMLIAKLRESTLGEKFAGLNDANGVAELFHFAHDVRGEDDGFAVVAAFVDESGDGSGGRDIEAIGRLENGGEHAESSGFARAVSAQEAVNLAGLASKADVIDGADFAAFLVLEALGQATSFDHQRTPN